MSQSNMPKNRAERTSGSEGGSPVVAVSGNMARGAGKEYLPAPLLQTGAGGGSASRPPTPTPLLDYYAISARKATPDTNGVGSRRVKRFYQRYFTGVGVGGRLRILTLTTSDEAIGEGYDIHKDFRALVMRLRRRWGRFEYMGVKEVKGDRQHLHLVFRGEYMAQVQLSAMWASLHKSPVVDIRSVYKARGGARYLAKYLAKEAHNRYWASYNWVFQGWVGWSQRVRRAVGHYPSKGLLRSLARQDKTERQLAMDFFEWRYPPLWQYSLEHAEAIGS